MIFTGLFFVYDLELISMFAFRNVMTPISPPTNVTMTFEVSRSKN